MKDKPGPPVPFSMVVLLGLTLWVYSPLRRAGFVYDDLWRIVRNPAIQTFQPGAYFTRSQTVAAVESGLSEDIYQPLTTLSFAVDYRLWRLDPRPYHLENLLLHLLNGLLVGFLLRRFLNDTPSALVGAALFLLHPVQVQTVAWISQRSNLLCVLGILSALFCLFVGRFRFRFLAAGLALAAALAAKETAVVFPAIFWILCRIHKPVPPQSKNERIFLGASVGMILVYLLIRQGVVQHWTQGVEGSWIGNLGLGLLAFPVYLGKLLVPVALRPSYAYPDPQPVLLWGALGVALLFGWGTYRAWRPFPLLAAGLVWILIGLLPVLQIFPIRIFVGERYLYLPLVGFSLVVARLWQSSKPGRWATGVWMSALVAVTLVTVPHWQNEQSLWAYAIRQEPENAFSQVNYADTVSDPTTAETHYKLALQSSSSASVRFAALNNLASLALEQNKPEEARSWAEDALRLRSDDQHALYNLCLAEDRLGHVADARRVFQQLTHLDGVPPGLIEDLRKKAPGAAAT